MQDDQCSNHQARVREDAGEELKKKSDFKQGRCGSGELATKRIVCGSEV
jgi:hypothetical protein